MGVYQRSFGQAPGRYWVEVLEPICSGITVLREEWSAPLPATFTEDGYVLVDGWASPLVFEWRIVQPTVPVPPLSIQGAD